MVEAVTRSCTPAAPLTQPVQPNWEALANSFASLSTAIAWGSLIVAIIAVVAALAWGKMVTDRAEKEARAEAEQCARKITDKWLAEEAPAIIRRHLDNLQDATIGNGNDAKAADEIGKAAG